MLTRFDYIQYDEESKLKQQDLKVQFLAVEALVEKLLPQGRAKALVMTHLEEAYMWTGKAVRDEQALRVGVVHEQPERFEVCHD